MICRFDVIIYNPYHYQMEDPIQLKDEGNKHFQAGDTDKAIECYTKAVKACKDKKVLAVIYRNRSACYLKEVSSLVKHVAQKQTYHI